MNTRTDHIAAWCCTDCIMLHANGETPPHMTEAETDAWLESMGDIMPTVGRHTDDCGCSTWDSPYHRDVCETLEFSWKPCQSCGSTLGGERHAITLWEDGR